MIFERDHPQTLIEIGGGLVDNNKKFQILGATAVNALVVLGDKGGQTLAQLHSTTGVALKFDSDSANDKPASTGLLTARLWGFDILDRLVYEDITTDGTDAVTTDRDDWKTVFLLEPLTFGSGKKCIGNCVITNIAANVFYLGISANGIQSSYANIFIPKNAIGFFEMHVWYTLDTTVTDSINITQIIANGATNEVSVIVLSKTFGQEQGADVNSSGMEFKGVLREAMHNIFKGVKIGTTAQTLNFSITWGLRYT